MSYEKRLSRSTEPAASDPSGVHLTAQANSDSLSLLRMLHPDVLAEPSVFYRALRDHSPVHWDPYMHAWVVTSYAEVITVLTNCSADRTPAPDYLDRLGLAFMKPFAEIMLQQMMFMDGARHSRLRDICAARSEERRGGKE